MEMGIIKKCFCISFIFAFIIIDLYFDFYNMVSRSDKLLKDNKIEDE